MVIVGFYLIKYGVKFNDLGADFFDRRNREHATRRAVKRLKALGYNVHLKEATPAPDPVFSGERLMKFLLVLGRDIEIVVKTRARAESGARLRAA